jgi:peptide deformylase
MAIREIVIYGRPALRIHAKPVAEIDSDIRELADDMIDTMVEADGIGLAAPQVNESLAMCVVNCELIEEGTPPKVYINPEILSSEGNSVIEEGCLSIPDIREDVERPEIIRLKYTDIDGNRHEEACDGMLARVLQHEIDHLKGVLFVDRISAVKRSLLAKKLKKLASGN